MRRVACLSCLALLGAWNAAVADIVKKTPAHVTADSTPLPLQGRAVREYLWVDVYRIGVYFPDDVALRSLLKAPADVAVRIEILTDRLPEEPPEEWAAVFRDHLSGVLSAGLMQEFARLERGDVLWFVHDESGNSTITVNRDEFAVATGYGLVRGMLRLWLGPDPVSPPLREELIEDIRDE